MADLLLKNIKMKYEDDYILDNFYLHVKSGELLVLLGESGCGKTTLLKIVAGIIPPESGQILINYKDFTEYSPQKRKVGYVPQSQVLFPHMDVKENIAFGLKARKLSAEYINKKISWVSKLTQIEDLLERLPSEISGGQKQRVALSRAMAIDPHILLLDEPLSSIDATGRESLSLIIKKIQKSTKTTVLYVTHNHEEARLISDRVAIIDDGKVQQSGTMNQIYKDPKNFQIAKIIGKINIWQIITSKYLEEEKKTILSTSLSEFILPFKIRENVSGIELLPSEIDMKLEFKENKEKIKEKKKEIENIQKKPISKIQISGYCISIVDITESLYRMIIEVRKKTMEYIKVDIEKSGVDPDILINKKVVLNITAEKIKFF